MDIAIVGLGYVGVVAVAALSKAGHKVLGVDVDQGKVSSLRRGICPFYEPECSEFTSSGIAAGRLRFDCLDEVKEPLGEIALVAVGTPTQAYGGTDLPHWGAMQAQGCCPEVACTQLQSTGARRAPFLLHYGERTMIVPNNSEFSIPQLKMLLKQIEKILGRKISLEEWQKL